MTTAGKDVWVVQDIPVRVSIQNFEQRLEVVRRLVNMKNSDRAKWTEAVPQGSDCDQGAFEFFPCDDP